MKLEKIVKSKSRKVYLPITVEKARGAIVRKT